MLSVIKSRGDVSLKKGANDREEPFLIQEPKVALCNVTEGGEKKTSGGNLSMKDSGDV